MTFDDAGVVLNLSCLNKINLKKLQIWCESADMDEDFSIPSLEWLVFKVRDSSLAFYMLPDFANLQVLATNSLFAQEIESLSYSSPHLKVLEFVMCFDVETVQEYERMLAALSDLKLEYLGVYFERQIQLQEIKDICPELKVLVLDGDEDVSTELRSFAEQKNIYFEDSDLILNYAYPKHQLFF
jgi:hypothetical protein